MRDIHVIGLDIAKQVFHVVGLDKNGKQVMRKTLRICPEITPVWVMRQPNRYVQAV